MYNRSEFSFNVRVFAERKGWAMKALHTAIETMGKGIGNDIVKVDMFLNHRLDTALLFEMGKELGEYFKHDAPDLVLTVEASGIALALTAAHALQDIPVVFAKKGKTVVQSSEVAQSKVYSFTHKTENLIRVDKKYLPRGSRVLIVDDFLADGQAVNGLMDLCRQTECEVIGVGIGIEKGFQPGGQALREKGVKLLSLAIVDQIEDGKITLRNDG